MSAYIEIGNPLRAMAADGLQQFAIKHIDAVLMVFDDASAAEAMHIAGGALGMACSASEMQVKNRLVL